tara:strand:- start:6369 stop:6974 length:606 start_codon:yes stop_codon:yes gene_type:complete
MIKRIFNSAATIPLASILILIGLASALAASTTSVVQYYHFINSGHHLTVPTEPITLEVQPNTEYIIQHRVTGTHITANRPLQQLPKDLRVEVIDTATEEPLTITSRDGYMRSSFFGLAQRRDAIADFMTSDTTSITVSVPALDSETVLYIGPHYENYVEGIFPLYLTCIIVSLLLVLAAVAAIINRIMKTTPDLQIIHEQI